MPGKERIRQPISGPIDAKDMESFREQGWTLMALEWERQVPEEPADVTEAPFGLQVVGGGLEENSEETAALVTMLELLVEEGPYWRIAEELNRRGHRTRRGGKWGPVAVFEMLPRLIDVAPRIFSSAEWQQRRQTTSKTG